MMLIARHLTQVMEDSKRTEAELRSVGTLLREAGERILDPESIRTAGGRSQRRWTR
jgi:hypothetical protein